MTASPQQRRAPVLKTAVHRLRELALAAQPGDFLGPEEELRDLLGVSRPTYRQAVLMLEQDQLLTRRMGPHGGCYASRPDANSVARRAALYLQIEQATLHDLMDVLQGLQQHALTAACLCADDGARSGLRLFLNGLAEESRLDDLAWFLERERAFEHHILAMANNPALRLFFQIARKFVDDSPASQLLVASPAMRRLRAAAWTRIGEVVLAGATAEAIELSRQQHNAFVALVPGEALRGTAVRAA